MHKKKVAVSKKQVINVAVMGCQANIHLFKQITCFKL